ncbi:MAG: SIS domain-containing protein [Planctomycetota bacterium]|nr:SIS domain-containing protein [Planctomycetota bacterium]
MIWQTYIGQIAEVLAKLEAADDTGAGLDPDAAFSMWVDLAVGLPPNGAIHLIGNGASAAMASHFAADITKNCGFRANVFTDCALLTAMANDYGYETAYAIALDRYAIPGDLLVAVSSSGESPNILNACRRANELGITVSTVSGMSAGNTLRSLGRLNFYVPAPSYGLAESSHSALLHHWTDRLEAIHKARS